MLPTEFDGLKFQSEGEKTRVTSENINFLFNSGLEKVVAAYKYFAPNARDYFKRRWESAPQPNLDEQDFNWLIKKVTLYWMYCCIVNRKPVQITDWNWKHPQTNAEIQEIIDRRFGEGSAESRRLGAHMMGLSTFEYARWKTSWEVFINR
jgi:hypothetical protein